MKRVCVSLRLKECERMSVSCEVISAGLYSNGALGKSIYP